MGWLPAKGLQGSLLFCLYELIFWAALPFVSPYYLWRMIKRGGYARGFPERFGIFEREKEMQLRGLRPLWIHAVSVGEVELALRLIEKIRDTCQIPLLLSTTTSTGHALAERRLPKGVPLVYYPLDSRFCFGRVHRLLEPVGFILVEAELWPNHLRFCARRNIPLGLINARLSERHYPRYQSFRWFLQNAFQGFRLVTLSSEKDIERLVNLGFPRASLVVAGNLKYDTALEANHFSHSALLKDLEGFKDRPMWVAGSTHPGEEAALVEIFRKLKITHPNLLLALAPRHVERTPEIAELLRRRELSFVLRSSLYGGMSAPSLDACEVLLLDTTGELKKLYERATLIFMGKSLFGRGGQNIIEPAARGKAFVFGPHMENFEIIARDFLEAGAAIQVRDEKELEKETIRLLDHSAARDLLGVKAAQLVQQKKGALDQTVKAIQRMMEQL